MTSGIVAAIFAGLATALACGARSRMPIPGRAADARRAHRDGEARRLWAMRLVRWLRALTGAPGPRESFALVCSQVASRLRSGASVTQAWREELGSGAEAGSAGEAWDGVPAELAGLRGDSPGVEAAIVACRLSATSGAGLADVLDSCAEGIAEAEAARAERERARAGPAMTARLLAWLPVVGLGMGVLLGADPVGVALAGGVGSAGIILGVGCLVAGRVWVAALVRGAQRRSGSWPSPGGYR